MDGVHDMGGMHGFGAVVEPGSDRTHSEAWELRAQILSFMVGHGSRERIEALPPHEYLASSYYERWLAAAEQGARDRGLDTELRLWRGALAGDEDLRPPVTTDPERAAGLRARLVRAPEMAPASSPMFGTGDRVRVRRNRIEHHHRCPRYVRGAEGSIEQICGDDQVPGSDRGTVETVYTVRFSSEDLWGGSETEPRFAIHIDLWQSYLEPA